MVNKNTIQTAEYIYQADQPVDNPSSYSKNHIKVVCSHDISLTHLVPLTTENTDYNTVMEWVAEGNTITDNDPN